MTNHPFLSDTPEESGAVASSIPATSEFTRGRRNFLARAGGLSALALGSALLGTKSAHAGIGENVLAQPAASGATTPNRAAAFQIPRPLYCGKPHMLDNLTKEVFETHLNTPFRAHSLVAHAEENASDAPNAAPVKLELVGVEAGHGHDPQNGYESFSLFFRGPAAMPLEQNTYELQHKALGQPAIFIVPIGRDENGCLYEAVFNRLKRA